MSTKLKFMSSAMLVVGLTLLSGGVITLLAMIANGKIYNSDNLNFIIVLVSFVFFGFYSIWKYIEIYQKAKK